MTRCSADDIIAVGRRLYDSLDSCELCPMTCRVNRLEGEMGKCRSTAELKIASINLHFGEEPPLSGGGGSGTVFLSGCSLTCRYCQNYPLSQLGNGKIYEISQLTDAMLGLQKRGAENINFVTPDHMLPMILLALGEARRQGMDLPIVYNCSGYAKVDIVRQLAGIIDIYLVDMRYNDDVLAKRYSGCDNYIETNRATVKEMYRQVGNLKSNANDMAQSGVIVRHLVLPGNVSGSEGVFAFLANEVSRNVHVSLMSQYFPAHKAVGDRIIGRRITVDEFQTARDAFFAAGLKNGFIQELMYESL